MTRIKLIAIIPFLLYGLTSCLQNPGTSLDTSGLKSGASRMELYLPLLEGKNIALAANHSSLIGSTHLADTLLSLGIGIKQVFAPEHGFRGTAGAGEHILDGRDPSTGLPVISLYGKSKKPEQSMLQGIDLILFDIQDAGTRFFTYISTLTYIMEAAAESGIQVIVLDRPNPNGFYIDGPVLEEGFESFVGLHRVPVVYGMTIGEYARMVNGEGWLATASACDLIVIPLANYRRERLYPLPVKPSPNLPTWQSVFLYPSLCLFEGTVVSVGRGTDTPFTVFGHPQMHRGSFVFTPQSRPEAKYPKLEGKECFGFNLNTYAEHYADAPSFFNLQWIISAYNELAMGDDFFTPYFEKLAGTADLRRQIKSGMPQADIRASWLQDLDAFKKIRKKYLLYEDTVR